MSSSNFVSGDRDSISASKDVGFFGIFSGEKKKRLLLGGENDKTYRLAIACFAENETKGKDTKWVEVQFKGTKGEIETAKLDIRSIEVRLGISRDKIFSLQEQGSGSLEKEINDKAAAYRKDLEIARDFRGIVNKFLSSNGNDLAVKTFKAACDKFNTSGIQNEDIRQLCAECIREFKSTFSRVDEDKSTSDPSKPPKKYNYKINIEKSLRRFDREAYGIDRNFSVKSAPTEIRTLWGDTNLVLSRAQSVGSKSSGKLATRLQLTKGNDLYYVLTNGKIYHRKPEATNDYVPYSKDGTTWVLLSIRSLSSRLSLNPEQIKNTKDVDFMLLIENQLKDLKDTIPPEVAIKDMLRGLINDITSKGNLNQYQKFIDSLDKKSPHYSYLSRHAEIIKNVFDDKSNITPEMTLKRLGYLE